MNSNPHNSAQPSDPARVKADMEAVAALERDAQLMIRVREGDADSFAILLERHRGPVIHFLYRMVQNQPVAEELAQEVFLRVYRSRESYQPTAKFTTWLFRIATHLALNYIRDKRHERGQERIDGTGAIVKAAEDQQQDNGGASRQVRDLQPTAEAALVRDARLGEIRQAIEGLPAKQRAAVMMHKYQELEYSQIAGSLGCSESAVKSLLFRAYETLRARLAHLAV